MSVKRLFLGTPETIAGTVYGTIVVLATLAAGAKAYQHELWTLAEVAGVTLLVLWVAHVYAHGLGESLGAGHRLTSDEFRAVARRELSIPLASVLPIAAIALGALGLLEDGSAFWLAFGIGVATLVAQGIRYATLERLGMTGTIVTVAINATLGLVIVGLKVAVSH